MEQRDRGRNATLLLASVAAVGIVLVVGAAVAYFYHWRHSAPSLDPASWGQFGDFIGGVSNPVVALCALLLLAAGVQLQRETLVAAKRELAELKNVAALDRFGSQFAALVTLLATLKGGEANLTAMGSAAHEIQKAAAPEAIASKRAGIFERNLNHSAAALNAILALVRAIATLIRNTKELSAVEQEGYMAILRGLITTSDGVIILAAQGMGRLPESDKKLIDVDRLLEHMRPEVRASIQRVLSERGVTW